MLYYNILYSYQGNYTKYRSLDKYHSNVTKLMNKHIL